MRLLVAAVGRLGRRPETESIAKLTARIDALSRATRLGPITIREVEDRSGRGAEAEAALLLRAAGSARLVALDERGEAPSSAEFARRLERWRDQGAAQAAFLVGGADGHAPDLRERADWVLGLGPMTWPHALARLMLVEQIYRAATILAGHPYHRDG